MENTLQHSHFFRKAYILNLINYLSLNRKIPSVQAILTRNTLVDKTGAVAEWR